MNTKHLFGHTRSWQKIFVGTKIFSPFTPASRGSIDRRWSPLGGGGPATSRVILARYGADIEGTLALGQGTFTQYRGSNWHKYINRRRIFARLDYFASFNAARHSSVSKRLTKVCPRPGCVRLETVDTGSGQWPVVSGLLIKSTFPPTAAFHRQVPGPPPPQPLTKLISNSISSILFYVHFLD